VEVDDRGSDVTIFTFAGLAVLYAGLPSFEFRRLLESAGDDYNLVFFRDIRRMCYHLRPGGEKDGLAFYEAQVRRVIESLGSTVNVGVGVSVGGSAALYFGARCGFDQVVAFSPGFPLSVYCSPLRQLQTYLNLPRLVRWPKAYAELILVTLGTAWSARRLQKTIGPAEIWPVLDEYRNCPKRPQAAVYYGRGCGPDARQAKLFTEFPEVECIGLPTPYHNCAGFLKRRGELGSTILGHVRTAVGRE
jgi:pimeloyl-ACP methyl ester carboxylesterase